MKAKWRDREFEITSVGTIDGYIYDLSDVELLDTPDFWTRLEHQYAGMAMQGMLSNPACENLITKAIVKEAVDIATALVEKLKEKEERK